MLSEAGSAREVYGLSDAALGKIRGITNADAQAIIESRKTWNLDEELFKLRERGIGFLSIEQKIIRSGSGSLTTRHMQSIISENFRI